MRAYHLVPADGWAESPLDRPYAAPSLETEGFVHLTHDPDELMAAGNRHYTADSRPYLALAIDLDRLTVPWRYDGDERFPHAYGPLDRAAVDDVLTVVRDADGTFRTVAPR